MTPRNERVRLAAQVLSIVLAISRLTGRPFSADVATAIWHLTEPGRRDDLMAFVDRLEKVLATLEKEFR
jgi:hypothetical protein